MKYPRSPSSKSTSPARSATSRTATYSKPSGSTTTESPYGSKSVSSSTPKKPSGASDSPIEPSSKSLTVRAAPFQTAMVSFSISRTRSGSPPKEVSILSVRFVASYATRRPIDSPINSTYSDSWYSPSIHSQETDTPSFETSNSKETSSSVSSYVNNSSSTSDSASSAAFSLYTSANITQSWFSGNKRELLSSSDT